MTFTEIKERKSKIYYYRVFSFRKGKKVSKKRVYLGVNLSKKDLSLKENIADKEFGVSKKNSKLKNIEKLKTKIIKILKRNKIKRAGIFGSYARGEQTINSDIDILVELGKPMGFAFVGVQFELEDKLKKKVDLITYNSINPLLRERILNEEVRIL